MLIWDIEEYRFFVVEKSDTLFKSGSLSFDRISPIHAHSIKWICSIKINGKDWANQSYPQISWIASYNSICIKKMAVYTRDSIIILHCMCMGCCRNISFYLTNLKLVKIQTLCDRELMFPPHIILSVSTIIILSELIGLLWNIQQHAYMAVLLS